MASQKVELIITGDGKGATNAVEGLNASTVALGNVIGSAVTKAFDLLASAVSNMAAQMNEAVKASAEQEKNQMLLVNAMKQSGTFTKQAYEDNINLATSLQSLTTYGDENIVMVQKQLAMFGASGKELKDLTTATLDFAAATGTDLQSAGMLIARTIDGTSESIGKYKLGIEGAAGSTERMASMAAKMTELFGGSAQTEAKSFSGSIAQIKNQWSDLYETVGDVIVQNEATGVVFDYVKQAIADLNAWVIKHKQDLMIFVKSALMFAVDGFILLIGTIKWVITILGMAGTGFMELGNIVLRVVSLILNGWELILTGITNAAAKIPLVGDKFKAIGDSITSVFTSARTTVDDLAAGFSTTADSIASGTITVHENLTKLQDGATGFKNAIEAAGSGVVGVLEKIDVAQTEKQSKMIAQNKATMESLKGIWKTGSEVIVKVSDVASDEMVKNQKSLGQALEIGFKQTLGAMINAQIDSAVASLSVKAAEEIGKAALMGPLSLGVSLLAIPAIAAAATLAKAGVKALAGFAQGGIMGETGNRIPLPTGGAFPAMIHAGEVTGTPTRLAASGIGGINVEFNNYGAIANEVDITQIGKMIANQIQNELKGAI